MPRFKIEITQPKAYVVSLYSRSNWFAGWKQEDFYVSDIPFPEKVEEWQREYNIPDKRVIFHLHKLN